MCTPTRSSGSWVRYCTKPTRPCAITTPNSHAARPAAPWAPTARNANQAATTSPMSRKTGSAWSWAMASGSRPLRLASASPACGPLPVTKVPMTSTTPRGRHHDPGEPAQGRRHRQPCRFVGLAGGNPEGVRGRDGAHRDQEVAADHPRVEVRQHRHAPHHALSGDDEEREDGQPHHAPASWLRPVGEHDAGDGDGAEDEREQAVAELDDLVNAHLRTGRVRVVGTPGPGRAPQSGVGQPDRPAGDHDADVGDH